ncbi:MAG: leucyl/phenylalanyl-tRNA--protein transferase [Polaromonas sp.]|jgi:leucyl/phenylalanyl-tRNA--protein transferase
MKKPPRPLPWLDVGEDFPPVSRAWGHDDPAPGLLAAGSKLDVATLVQAYGLGIFPWYSEGQPTLWWSPNPRMVLQTQHFKLHRSLRKTLQHFLSNPACEVRFDTAFVEVINACASKPRDGQPGTWILPEMIAAYCALHAAGHAHSVETWVNNELVGGLYCVNLGGMVFGESMFAHVTDASKIAMCALVAFSRAQDVTMIDCQQKTGHLASLGAQEISRDEFTAHVAQVLTRPAPAWRFEPVYWQELMPFKTPNTP